MYVQTYLCEMLAPCIFSQESATAGQIESLDYVPGANFLGIVAQNYASFGDEAFMVFHSGQVSFGDAHPYHDGIRSVRTPLAFFKKKDDTSDAVRVNPPNEPGVQFKQQRKGWIFARDGAVCSREVKHSFQLKSSYDGEERRALKGNLFGYTSIDAGTTWSFEVRAPTPALLAQIEKSLVGERRIGRSASAQYGQVAINVQGKPSEANAQTPVADHENTLYLYADSNLAFLDLNGMPTFQPEPSAFGLPEGSTICWQRSQVRTRLYAPWNGKRAIRDPERAIIEKGSVLKVIIPAGAALKELAQRLVQGVGLHRAEGLGRVIVNPPFLAKQELKVPKRDWVAKPKRIEGTDATLEAWLTGQAQDSQVQEEVEAQLSLLRGPLARISASQWGQIRARAENLPHDSSIDNELFGEKTKAERDYGKGGPRTTKQGGFLMHGKKEWRPNQVQLLEDALAAFRAAFPKQEIQARRALARLAAEMAKATRNTAQNEEASP